MKMFETWRAFPRGSEQGAILDPWRANVKAIRRRDGTPLRHGDQCRCWV
jgi:hypothetical protein